MYSSRLGYKGFLKGERNWEKDYVDGKDQEEILKITPSH
jgi:hypothetical protein